MVKKIEETSEELKLIKTKVQDGNAIIGQERVLKELKAKKLTKIFLAKNCPQKLKEDIIYYAKLADIPYQELEQTNEDLGILCKKNFYISVVGIQE